MLFDNPLDGFWEERNAAPGKPRLVKGDRKAFKRDLVALNEKHTRQMAADIQFCRYVLNRPDDHQLYPRRARK